MLSRPVTGLSIAVTIQTWSAGLLAVADRLTAASIPGESGLFVSPSCQPSHQAPADSLKLSVVLVVNRFVPPSLGGGQLSNRGGKIISSQPDCSTPVKRFTSYWLSYAIRKSMLGKYLS